MYPMDEVPLLRFSNEWFRSFKARMEFRNTKSGSADVTTTEIAKILATYGNISCFSHFRCNCINLRKCIKVP